MAYLATSKFLAHVDQVVALASAQDAQTMIREQNQKARIDEENRAKQAAAAAQKVRQEQEEQLARKKEMEEQQRSAAAQTEAIRQAREERSRAKGYVDGWKQGEKCAPFRAKHDALKKEGDAGDIYAIQAMVHIDAEAELSGCKYDAQLDN